MASLTETAYLARKGINIGAILLVLIIILRVAWNLAVGVRNKYFPPPPPPPTVSFGKLPAPNAQNNIATPSGLTYTLETVDGNLPVLPVSMKVYFMPKQGPNFGSFDKMTSQARKLGFLGTPAKVSPTAWRFADTTNPLRTLDIDELSGNFRLVYNYASDPSLFNEKNFTSVDKVTADAQSFFDGLGLLASDLKAGTPSVAYFRFDAGALTATTALGSADAVGVTLNRADVEKHPVVSPDARQGQVFALLSGASDSKKKVLEARYFYNTIDQENWATYPLVKSSEAFDRLKSGRAVFASLPTPLSTSIALRQVFVAYLDPYPPQTYLQPVLVFLDQKGFVAYVPLVSPDWLQ